MKWFDDAQGNWINLEYMSRVFVNQPDPLRETYYVFAYDGQEKHLLRKFSSKNQAHTWMKNLLKER